MQEDDVEVVGLQSIQGLLDGGLDRARIPVGSTLWRVSEFGTEDDVCTATFERRAQELLAPSRCVTGSRVEEVHAELQRCIDDRMRRRLIRSVAPGRVVNATVAELPRAQPDRADSQTGSPERPCLQDLSP